MSTPKKLSLIGVMWNGLKRPLICGAIMLAAAVSLIELQAKKSIFDKKQNAGYQLVSDPELKPGDDVSTMPVDAFATNVKARAEAGGPLRGDVDAFDVVKRSAEELSSQSFKTRTELSTKLAEGIYKQKSEKLKPHRESLEKAVANEIECDELSDRAKTQLGTSVKKEDKIDIASILKNANSKSPLAVALKDNPIRTRSEVRVGDVQNAIDNFYGNKKTSSPEDRTAMTSRIGAIDTSFQKIVTGVNEELRVQMELSAEERSKEKIKPIVSSSAVSIDPTFALILDDKQGIGGVYWLLRVALTGMVLFGLLYLILIPLKHLFFWAASGEALTEYVKKLLENKGPSVGPTVARAAIVTVAAATVAGGAALVANGVPFNKSADPVTADEIVQKIGKLKNPDKKPDPSATPGPVGTDGEDEAHVNRALIDGMVMLAGRMERLENAYREIDTTPNVDTRKFTEAVTKFNGLLGNNSDDDQAQSVFGRLKALDGIPGKFETKFAEITGRIGDKKNSNDTLFGRLDGVSNTLGTRDQDPTVVESLRKFGISTSADPNTLFGRMNATQQSADKARDLALDVRRDQFGSVGGNFGTQTKRIFSGERYRVSQSAYDEIVRQFTLNADSQARLRRLVNPDTEYTENILRDAIANDGLWKREKSKILRITRVARY